MKKVFEIEWDYGSSGKSTADLDELSLERLLSNAFIVRPKVTEIKPPNFCYASMSVEYCECNALNTLCVHYEQGGKVYCSNCYKVVEGAKSSTSESPKEYCNCPKHLSVGVCCDVCHKSFKDKPKPPIEITKLTDHGEGKPIKGYNLKRVELDIIGIVNKINQIIDWIENRSKGK